MRTELKSEGKRLPYVSVIVITKNNSKTIEDCIISLVNQSYSKKMLRSNICGRAKC